MIVFLRTPKMGYAKQIFMFEEKMKNYPNTVRNVLL